MNQQRKMRTYLHEINKNVLLSEHTIREQLAKYAYEFETGRIQLNDSTVTYSRIIDPVLLLQQQISALQANNQFITHDNLIPNNTL